MSRFKWFFYISLLEMVKSNLPRLVATFYSILKQSLSHDRIPRFSQVWCSKSGTCQCGRRGNTNRWCPGTSGTTGTTWTIIIQHQHTSTLSVWQIGIDFQRSSVIFCTATVTSLKDRSPIGPSSVGIKPQADHIFKQLQQQGWEFTPGWWLMVGGNGWWSVKIHTVELAK